MGKLIEQRMCDCRTELSKLVEKGYYVAKNKLKELKIAYKDYRGGLCNDVGNKTKVELEYQVATAEIYTNSFK